MCPLCDSSFLQVAWPEYVPALWIYKVPSARLKVRSKSWSATRHRTRRLLSSPMDCPYAQLLYPKRPGVVTGSTTTSLQSQSKEQSWQPSGSMRRNPAGECHYALPVCAHIHMSIIGVHVMRSFLASFPAVVLVLALSSSFWIVGAFILLLLACSGLYVHLLYHYYYLASTTLLALYIFSYPLNLNNPISLTYW